MLRAFAERELGCECEAVTFVLSHVKDICTKLYYTADL